MSLWSLLDQTDSPSKRPLPSVDPWPRLSAEIPASLGRPRVMEKKQKMTVAPELAEHGSADLGPLTWVSRVTEAFASIIGKRQQKKQILLHTACSGTGMPALGLKASTASPLVRHGQNKPRRSAAPCK